MIVHKFVILKHTSDNTGVAFVCVLWTNLPDSRMNYENKIRFKISQFQACELVQYCNKYTNQVIITLVTFMGVLTGFK